MTAVETFKQSRLWASNHLSTATYISLATDADELSLASDSVALFNPENLDFEQWFDIAAKMGVTGVFLTVKHWDGLCLWDSASPRCVTNSPWYALRGRLPAVDFARMTRAYGLSAGAYYCVQDKYFESLYGTSNAALYTAYTVDRITEVIDYHDALEIPLELILLDGWGDAPVWSPVDFTLVDYDTIMDLITTRAPQCVKIVNNHEVSIDGVIHGDVCLYERQTDHLVTGLDGDSAVALWDPLHWDLARLNQDKWFRHTDSPAETMVDSQNHIGRFFLTLRMGEYSHDGEVPYVYIANFSTEPDGSMGADTNTMLSAGTTNQPLPTINDLILLPSGDAVSRLENQSYWTRTYTATTNSVDVGPTGHGYISDAGGAVYARNDLTFTDGAVELDFYFETVTTNCTIAVMRGTNLSATADDRFAFVKLGTAVTFRLESLYSAALHPPASNYTGNASLDVPPNAIEADRGYRLRISKVGNNLRGDFWAEVNGRYELWGRVFGTDSNVGSGLAGFYISDSSGTPTTGINITGFRIYQPEAAPAAPTLSLSGDAGGRFINIQRADGVATKLYRSVDSGASYEVAGVTAEGHFIDPEWVADETYLYRAIDRNRSHVYSVAYSNAVSITPTTAEVAGAIRIQKSIAFNDFMFFMESTGGRPATGKAITAKRAIDGEDFDDCLHPVSEVSGGWYKINLAASDLDGDSIGLKFTATGAKQRNILIVTQP